MDCFGVSCDGALSFLTIYEGWWRSRWVLYLFSYADNEFDAGQRIGRDFVVLV